MRLRTFAVVVGTLVVASSPGGRPLAAGGPTTDGGERIVARDSKVHQIFALGGSVVYRRAVEAGGRQWMRIVAGRRLRVRGLPAGSSAVEHRPRR